MLFMKSGRDIKNVGATLNQDVAIVKVAEMKSNGDLTKEQEIFIVADTNKQSFEVVSDSKGMLFKMTVNKVSGADLKPGKMKGLDMVTFFTDLSKKSGKINYDMGMYPLSVVLLVKLEHIRLAINTCNGENVNLPFKTWTDAIEQTITTYELGKSESEHFVSWIKKIMMLTADELRGLNQWYESFTSDKQSDTPDNVDTSDTQVSVIDDEFIGTLESSNTLDDVKKVLNPLKKDSLIELCDWYELPNGGNKKQLIEKLVVHLENTLFTHSVTPTIPVLPVTTNGKVSEPVVVTVADNN